jgi:peptidoglycan-associated lipoprotein
VLVKFKYAILLVLIMAAIFMIGCPKEKPEPVVEPPPPPPPVVEEVTPPPPPPPPPVAPLSLTTIYFDYDKSDIRMDARDIMAQNGKSLSDHPTAAIQIEGYCDERGTDEYNLALGERRANAARDYLVNYGIAGAKIGTISYGESRPAVPGSGEDAWSRNRRAEFKVISE